MKRKKIKILTSAFLCLSCICNVQAEDVTGDFTNLTGTDGGAISNTDNMNIINSTFTNNTATSHGGAVYNNGILTITGSTFEGNTGLHGGAIYNAADLSIADGITFTNNKAYVEGSAIANYGTNLSIGDNVQFKDNLSFLDGHSYSGASEMATLYSEGTTSRKNIVTIGNNVLFENNKASGGAALYLYGNNDVTIGDGAKFINNVSQVSATDTTLSSTGSAIKLASDGNGNVKVTVGNNAEFSGNKAKFAGAVYVSNEGDSFSVGDNATFKNNYASSYGGALINSGTTAISIGGNAKFEDNKSEMMGGAIVSGGTLTIGDNASFKNNIATTNAGGALAVIPLDGRTTPDATIGNNSSFVGNTAALGGALYNGGNLEIGDNASFKNNTATASVGGAMYSANNTKIGKNAVFDNNSATHGGAVYATNTFEIGSGATFTNNSASSDGGAIYTTSAIQLTDPTFINNKAEGKGGAIFANNDVTIIASSKDVVLEAGSTNPLTRATTTGNNDIYMNKDASTLTLNAAQDKSIVIGSGISGTNYALDVNTDAVSKGTLVLNSAIENASINVKNGAFVLGRGSNIDTSTLEIQNGAELNTIDNQITTYGNNITLDSGAILSVDVDIANQKADNFSNSTVAGPVTVANINSLNVEKLTTGDISFSLAEALGLTSGVVIADSLQRETKEVLTPIRHLVGSVKSDGTVSFVPRGNSYNDYNPAVMNSAVAAQVGGYLTQLNSYDEAFRNMDMYMSLTKAQRLTLKNANKYVASYYNLPYNESQNQYNNAAGWFRPYSSIENVGLKNGPRVQNMTFGSFAGLDSGLHEFKSGWDGMMSIYAGYNGSSQKYQGNSIWQNGGTIGLTGMLYKGNFFTGLTTNIGANVADAHNTYGNEDFAMLTTGVASKTGYNIEAAKGKFIIQPSYLMSYSFINTFNYTNSAGIKIDADPLHAIQMEPGLKFILNLENGWQPYAGVSIVWNIIDQTQFKANDAALPDLSVKPFIKYGMGVRKTVGESITGFLQSFVTNGGRNGVGVQAGCRIKVGKKNPKP